MDLAISSNYHKQRRLECEVSSMIQTFIGMHTLTVSMIDDGFVLDQICVTSSLSVLTLPNLTESLVHQFHYIAPAYQVLGNY